MTYRRNLHYLLGFGCPSCLSNLSPSAKTNLLYCTGSVPGLNTILIHIDFSWVLYLKNNAGILFIQPPLYFPFVTESDAKRWSKDMYEHTVHTTERTASSNTYSTEYMYVQYSMLYCTLCRYACSTVVMFEYDLSRKNFYTLYITRCTVY